MLSYPFQGIELCFLLVEEDIELQINVYCHISCFSPLVDFLYFQDVMIESSNLDKIRPTYEASVAICTQDGLLSVSTHCYGISASLHSYNI